MDSTFVLIFISKFNYHWNIFHTDEQQRQRSSNKGRWGIFFLNQIGIGICPQTESSGLFNSIRKFILGRVNLILVTHPQQRPSNSQVAACNCTKVTGHLLLVCTIPTTISLPA